MKRSLRLAACAAMLLAVATLRASLPASDTFDRADSTDLGANWTNLTPGPGRFDVVSNEAKSFGSSTNNDYAWNADAFANDQYAQVTPTNATNVSGPTVRSSLVARTYYVFGNDGGGTNSAIAKVVAGTYTALLGSLPNVVSGDVLRLEVVGTTLQAFINGSSVGSVSDATLASGAGGMIAFGNNQTLNNWSAGNMGGATAPTPRGLLLGVGP